MDTGNYLYRQGVSPETRVAISMKNKIYTKHEGSGDAFVAVGVTSTFDISESRTIETARGVGFGDQIAELIPGVTDAMTITLNRLMLYLAGMFQVLGYKGGGSGLVRSLKHHQWPFDIKQELVLSRISSEDSKGLGGGVGFRPSSDAGSTYKAIFTFYDGCWINSYDTSFPADTAQVTENCSITVTDIIDGTSNYNSVVLDTGNNPFVPGQAGASRFGSNVGVATPTPIG